MRAWMIFMNRSNIEDLTSHCLKSWSSTYNKGLLRELTDHFSGPENG